jgi:hypothetical protein
VTLRARWVTLRARWVTLRARWVTLSARWVTLRARWVTWSSTAAERVALRDRKRAEYVTLKQQWQSISPAQEANWSKWRERKTRVDKDVVRSKRESNSTTV